jgi:hypothetical protein
MINNKIVIAFDLDDTLLLPSVATGLPVDTPNYEVIDSYMTFKKMGFHMIIWSGSGVDYAARWAEKLGLMPDEIRMKQKSDDIDIAIDDCVVDLAKMNIRVKRLNNSISREGWNKHEKI